MAVRAHLLALLLLALPACLAPAPRHEVASAAGRVLGDSPTQARLVSELLDDLAPRVRALLPGTRAEPLEVWVQRRLALYSNWTVDDDVPAFTVEGEHRIHMLENDPRDLSAALAHELVHALLGPTWASLPPVAEEGLADWVQEQLHPELAGSLRADHLAKAGAAFGGLRFGLWQSGSLGGRQLASFSFPSGDELGAPIDDPQAAIDDGGRSRRSFWQPYEVSVSDPRLYGLGYVAVVSALERIGVDGLHARCRAASERGERLTAAELLQAGGLTADVDHWRQEIVERVGRGELLALGATLAPFLRDLLDGRVEGASGALGNSLWSQRPRLGLVGGEVRLSLGSIARLWDGRRWWGGRRGAVVVDALEARPREPGRGD